MAIMMSTEEWLRSLEQSTTEYELIHVLNCIAEQAIEMYDARLWFVEIFGERWSYVAGVMPDDPAVTQTVRKCLGPRMGLVVDTWGHLRGDDQAIFIEFLKRLIGTRNDSRPVM